MYRQLLALLLFLWILPTFATEMKETILLRGDEWCPYACQPNSEKPGFLIEIAQHIFKKAGYLVDYQIIPWARAVSETRKGQYHAVSGVFKEDVPDFIFPKNEIARAGLAFFVKPGTNWKFENMSSLEAVSIGVIRDYSYGKQFDDYIEKYKKDPQKVQIGSGENAPELNIKKLIMGRIKVLLEDPLVVQYYTANYPQPEKLVNVGTLSDERVYIAFSPHLSSSKQYANILSEGVQELRVNGKLQEILAKYGLQDWK
ncbi:MAG: hypothetical protein BWK79_03160 [Beggiatoa sp. IS2]|nr:MAG: hypothetical protein BWK79_03160 [Beggiatoa sp. IS2]